MRTLLATEPFTLARDGRAFSYAPGQRLTLDEDTALALGGVVLDPATLPAVDWWGAPGRVLGEEWSPAPLRPMLDRATPGALTIVQGVGFDPGCAAYRFHSAVNETTKHASMFFRWKDSSPYTSLRQYDGEHDLRLLQAAILDADVVHCHVNYLAITNSRVRPAGRIVRHYHGSLPDGTSMVEQELDDAYGAIQVGARLSLLAESPRMHWLPIPVPVDRYRAMVKRTAEQRRSHAARGVFRVAHSPTNRDYKGTDVLLETARRLRNRGIGIEIVLIEGVRHGVALACKATCDAVFDSFWLGIQGSGLEGGAMGLPVIAGDETVRALYQEHVGRVPYTFANDAASLEAQLSILATDERYYQDEAERVGSYVREYHDYAAVAARYEAILDAEL